MDLKIHFQEKFTICKDFIELELELKEVIIILSVITKYLENT